ncbi:MAG TPA: hypothetical protein PLF40_04560 [Kofleriaceae bacterium]|nr:hypothetical protein [Kofleriaceae bacterium]
MRTTLALILLATTAAACGSKEVTTEGDFFAGGGSDKSNFSAGLSADMAKTNREQGSGSNGAVAAKPGGKPDENVGSASPPPPVAGSGSSAAPPPVVGSAAPPPAAGSAAPPPAAGSATVAQTPTENLLETTGVIAPSPGKTAVAPPADLAAIKFTLAPGWARDLGEAGTVSVFLGLAAKGLGTDAEYVFHYSIEKSGAPKDREAYKTWLAAEKIMTVTRDRQRGAAWFLEGKSPDGAPMFRYQVRYGGKFLICGGSAYKDGSKFRDAVMIQIEKICESMTL